jgi:hypothetical protein
MRGACWPQEMAVAGSGECGRLLELLPAPGQSRPLVWNATMALGHGQEKWLPWDSLEPSWACNRVLTEGVFFLASCRGSKEKSLGTHSAVEEGVISQVDHTNSAFSRQHKTVTL